MIIKQIVGVVPNIQTVPLMDGEDEAVCASRVRLTLVLNGQPTPEEDGAEDEEFFFGLNPEDIGDNAAIARESLRQWMVDGGIIPSFVPPTPEELRERMAQLSARQLRLVLASIGITESDVEAYLANINDDFEREAAFIEWRHAKSFDRTHPLIDELGENFDLPPGQIDDLWNHAMTI